LLISQRNDPYQFHHPQISSEEIMATAPKKKEKAQPQEATALLRADHKLVNELFEQFESARGTAKKRTLAEQICKELTVHAQIEEEIFYPAVREALKDKELIPEATVEHATMKDLIAQIEEGDSEDDLWNARVKVLGEYVKHHVKEEQTEIFPKAKESKLDLVELGAALLQRKEELMSEME
jgi:hemerythrin superfamily protein